ncbi:MAG: sigma-70 family RNA polymerase sigma factor [Solirubrobacterales bacterium]|nr:sigma-70 family RNA polymerase sigma factor [Solirubrobacterales bacterium]
MQNTHTYPALEVTPSLEEPDVAALYRTLATRLEQIVRLDVRAPEVVIEDACQFAWGRLVCNFSRVQRDRALSWLATTAVREAVRLVRRANRDVALEDGVDVREEVACRSPAATCEDLIEQRERLELIRLLPERQQRLLWLQALGMSYDEIARYTGCSHRTIERQVLRARSRIRALAAA